VEIPAELIGILYGDGSICRHHYEVRISLGKKDREYAEYLKELLRGLGLSPKEHTKVSTNEIWIRVWSKQFWRLIKKWFKPGRKHLKKPPKNLKDFIKGFFDTDGCVYIDKKKYPVISIKSKDRNILLLILGYLHKLGIKAYLYGPETTQFGSKVYKLRIYGIKNCKIWMLKIGTSHPLKRKILESALQPG